MNEDQFLSLIERSLENRGIGITPSGIDAFLNAEFLNFELLNSMSDKEIIESLEIVLNDVAALARSRILSPRPRTATRRDVAIVLRKHFCSLPPFCKGPTKLPTRSRRRK